MRRLLIIVTLALLTATAPALAAGLMKPKDSDLPDLQIAEHRVNVVINNGFAITEVDQVFHNPHDRDLDAIYTFPLPKDASLSELSLWIDGQEVIGEVVEKEKGREIVKQEHEAGRETALAEKREYLAFDVFVSPVRAGADTRVRLVYLQPIKIDSGIGRYVYPLEEGKIDEEMHTFWDRTEVVSGVFSFDCTLRSSYPVDEVRTPDVPSTITTEGAGEWRVWIDGEEGNTRLDRDVVVYYRLSEDTPARVDLLPYRDGTGEGTFMLVVTPGNDLEETVDGVDWTIVLDLSGSMSAKISTAADAVTRSFDHLRATDRFRIIVFSGRARTLLDWQDVNDASIERARETLMALGVEGGTNLYDGFDAALRGLDEDRPSAVLIVSDGGANIGPTEHRDFLDLLETKDVRVFTFVMGQGANRPLLGRIAEASGGFSMDVSNRDDLYGRILQAKTKLGREALHGVEVELDGARVVDVTPKRLPSAYHGQQIVVFGRYLKPGEVNLEVRGKISGEDRSWNTRIELPEHYETFPEIERLWALARTEELQRAIDDGGDASELREAIVDLGTTYSIVTDHTSMIVVREEQFAEHGIDRRNRDRVERERDARENRGNQAVVQTRADKSQPMYGNSRSHGFGTGASGPALLALLAGLYGARRMLGRRKPRC